MLLCQIGSNFTTGLGNKMMAEMEAAAKARFESVAPTVTVTGRATRK